jgi:hypothetical protein
VKKRTAFEAASRADSTRRQDLFRPLGVGELKQTADNR